MTSLSVILRAEHHDDGAPFTAPRPRDRSPTRATMTTPSVSPADDAHHHKRAPAGQVDEADEQGKRRARGRPRVEPKDDTAADVSSFGYCSPLMSFVVLR
ncbi:hypothetical protein IMZ48_01455 [Candidatus Bathyarchaeota archaeon]|nr:hypothetical protein [Candidatus Bathyarchaeota archaeon]